MACALTPWAFLRLLPLETEVKLVGMGHRDMTGCDERMQPQVIGTPFHLWVAPLLAGFSLAHDSASTVCRQGFGAVDRLLLLALLPADHLRGPKSVSPWCVRGCLIPYLLLALSSGAEGKRTEIGRRKKNYRGSKAAHACVLMCLLLDFVLLSGGITTLRQWYSGACSFAF